MKSYARRSLCPEQIAARKSEETEAAPSLSGAAAGPRAVGRGCLQGPGGPGSSGSRGSEPFADLSPFSLWTSGRGGADAPQVQHLPPALLAVAQTPLLNLSVAGGVKTLQ